MFKPKQPRVRLYDPMMEVDGDEDECTEHLFMPIDSDRETLACRNCGLVITREQYNIFAQQNS